MHIHVCPKASSSSGAHAPPLPSQHGQCRRSQSLDAVPPAKVLTVDCHRLFHTSPRLLDELLFHTIFLLSEVVLGLGLLKDHLQGGSNGSGWIIASSCAQCWGPNSQSCAYTRRASYSMDGVRNIDLCVLLPDPSATSCLLPRLYQRMIRPTGPSRQ